MALSHRPLHDAVLNNDVESVRIILARNMVPVNQFDEEGYTPLAYAAKWHARQYPNCSSQENQARNAAALQDCKAIIDALMSKGADKNWALRESYLLDHVVDADIFTYLVERYHLNFSNKILFGASPAKARAVLTAMLRRYHEQPEQLLGLLPFKLLADTIRRQQDARELIEIYVLHGAKVNEPTSYATKSLLALVASMPHPDSVLLRFLLRAGARKLPHETIYHRHLPEDLIRRANIDIKHPDSHDRLHQLFRDHAIEINDEISTLIAIHQEKLALITELLTYFHQQHFTMSLLILKPLLMAQLSELQFVSDIIKIHPLLQLESDPWLRALQNLFFISHFLPLAVITATRFQTIISSTEVALLATQKYAPFKLWNDGKLLDMTAPDYLLPFIDNVSDAHHILKLLEKQFVLLKTCIENKVNVFAKSLEQGCDVATRDHENHTLLRLAVLRNHHQIVRILKDHQATLSIDEYGETEIHLAAAKNDDKLLRLLMENEPSEMLTKRNAAGETALHVAARHGATATTALLMSQMQLDEMASLNNAKCNALDVAIQAANQSDAIQYKEIISALLKAGLNESPGILNNLTNPELICMLIEHDIYWHFNLLGVALETQQKIFAQAQNLHRPKLKKILTYELLESTFILHGEASQPFVQLYIEHGILVNSPRSDATNSILYRAYLSGANSETLVMLFNAGARVLPADYLPSVETHPLLHTWIQQPITAPEAFDTLYRRLRDKGIHIANQTTSYIYSHQDKIASLNNIIERCALEDNSEKNSATSLIELIIDKLELIETICKIFDACQLDNKPMLLTAADLRRVINTSQLALEHFITLLNHRQLRSRLEITNSLLFNYLPLTDNRLTELLDALPPLSDDNLVLLLKVDDAHLQIIIEFINNPKQDPLQKTIFSKQENLAKLFRSRWECEAVINRVHSVEYFIGKDILKDIGFHKAKLTAAVLTETELAATTGFAPDNTLAQQQLAAICEFEDLYTRSFLGSFRKGESFKEITIKWCRAFKQQAEEAFCTAQTVHNENFIDDLIQGRKQRSDVMQPLTLVINPFDLFHHHYALKGFFKNHCELRPYTSLKTIFPEDLHYHTMQARVDCITRISHIYCKRLLPFIQKREIKALLTSPLHVLERISAIVVRAGELHLTLPYHIVKTVEDAPTLDQAAFNQCGTQIELVSAIQNNITDVSELMKQLIASGNPLAKLIRLWEAVAQLRQGENSNEDDRFQALADELMLAGEKLTVDMLDHVNSPAVIDYLVTNQIVHINIQKYSHQKIVTILQLMPAATRTTLMTFSLLREILTANIHEQKRAQLIELCVQYHAPVNEAHTPNLLASLVTETLTPDKAYHQELILKCLLNAGLYITTPNASWCAVLMQQLSETLQYRFAQLLRLTNFQDYEVLFHLLHEQRVVVDDQLGTNILYHSAHLTTIRSLLQQHLPQIADADKLSFVKSFVNNAAFITVLVELFAAQQITLTLPQLQCLSTAKAHVLEGLIKLINKYPEHLTLFSQYLIENIERHGDIAAEISQTKEMDASTLEIIFKCSHLNLVATICVLTAERLFKPIMESDYRKAVAYSFCDQLMLRSHCNRMLASEPYAQANLKLLQDTQFVANDIKRARRLWDIVTNLSTELAADIKEFSETHPDQSLDEVFFLARKKIQIMQDFATYYKLHIAEQDFPQLVANWALDYARRFNNENPFDVLKIKRKKYLVSYGNTSCINFFIEHLKPEEQPAMLIASLNAPETRTFDPKSNRLTFSANPTPVNSSTQRLSGYDPTINPFGAPEYRDFEFEI